MITPTYQEHRVSRERTKEREPELQRPVEQRRQKSVTIQPHKAHALAGDIRHPLHKKSLGEKSIPRTGERPMYAVSPTAGRDEDFPVTAPDSNLFSILMEPNASFLPVSLGHAATPESPSAGAPMALWQPLENELDKALVNPPAGPVSVTLLLPRLGDVDARLQTMSTGGWDIALRFSPAALDALAVYEERCRHSLRRRLACQVRLRFEQRGEWA